MKTHIQNLFIVLAIFAGIHHATAQGTTVFTYQGQLHDGGTNANGTYTMTFKLYDSPSGGNQFGSTITTSPTLANGLFSVNLDFGNAFNGSARWLDITVQSGSDSEELSPRVQVLPTPYAQFAAVAATVTNGAIMNSQLAGNAVATTNIQNGAITTTQIAAGAVTNANLTANAVATGNIQDAAVTDAKIVSVSGSKVSGVVMNAASLTNGIWNSSVGSYQSTANVLGFYANNSPMLLMAPTGNRGNPAFAIFGQLGIFGDLNLNGGSIDEISELDAEQVADGGDGDIDIQGDLVMEGGNGSPGSIYSADFTESLFFGTDALNVNGGLNVFGELTVGTSSSTQFSVTTAGDVSATSFNQTSDRNLKEKFTPINEQEILKRVARLPISSWDFKTEGTTRHIGPMAQDFYAAFNVGTDDKHIATVDESGVALAAIQGLNQEVTEQAAQMKERDAQIEALNKRLADLEQLVKTSTQK